MSRILLIILCFPLCLSCTVGGSGDEIIRELDEVLRLKDVYEKAFVDKVEAMKKMRSSDMLWTNEYSLNKMIADEYSAVSYDSTVAYLDRNCDLAIAHADAYRKMESSLLEIKAYIRAGYHSEAIGELSDILYPEVPDSLKRLYFEVRHSLAGEMMVYSGSIDMYEKAYAERNMMRDSLFAYTEPGSYAWYDLNREVALSARDSASVRDCAAKMLSLAGDDLRKYAAACYFYSEGVQPRGSDEVVEYLCRSAIADVKAATKDYASLNTLAEILFQKGDISRAFRYSADHCMQDALAFNGKLRLWQVSTFFPKIQNAYEHLQERQNRRMTVIVVFMCLLASSLGLMLVYIYRHHHVLLMANARLAALNSRLEESDKVKDEYIALFLGTVSENIAKERKYRDHVMKYLKRGNDKYLMDEIVAMPSIEDDIRLFYKMFDNAFIKLYPSFVAQFNALLADGCEILPKDSDILTPELRIFALIKLGVTDSGKIASLLHYSANTVYNYRAKIKNKAKGSRGDFEDAVRAIA